MYVTVRRYDEALFLYEKLHAAASTVENKILLAQCYAQAEQYSEAVLLLSVDGPIPHDVVEQACALEGVKTVMPLAF